ncbi:MAG: hypothetical protein IT258_03290 [Saprospiraceae bacterium]|nr:hypothetical protein [Saprospiraceae bacterium]
MDNLLNLVRSLTAKEKSQFTKHARQHLTEKDPKKMLLFHLVNQQLRGEIKDYQKQAAKQLQESNLPSLKNQLYNELLESLAQSSVKTARSELSQLIDETEILLERGLLKQALARIEKAKKMATSHHLHFQFLEISLLHRRIVRQYKTRDLDHQLMDEQAACHERLDWIREEFELLKSYEEQFLQNRKDRSTKAAKALPELSKWNLNDLRSFEGKAYFYLLSQLNANSLRQYDQAIQAARHLIELFETNEALIADNLPRYFRSVTNYLNACIRVGRLDEARQKLEEIKKIKPKSFYAEGQKQSLLVSQEIILLFQEKNFGQITFLAPKVKSVLSKYAVFIPFERALGIAYNMAISFFLKGNLEGSLEWLNTCFQAKDHSELNEKVAGKDIGIYVQGSAMVFRVIVCFEMGNLKLAKSFLEQAAYYLENRSLAGDLLWEILSALKKLVANKEDRMKILLGLKESLQGQANYEEYLIWVEKACGK